MPARPLKEIIKTASRPGLIAVKRNWTPIVAIQLVALGLVFLYFTNPGFHAAMRSLAQFKTDSGILFVFLTGCIAGGVLPEAAKLIAGKLRKFDRAWMGQMLFNSLVYGIVGVEIDLFYRFQAFLFGTGTDALTLAIKTAFDMFVFAPLVAIPTAVGMFEWRARKWAGVRRLLTVEGYIEKVLPAQIPAWAFFIPILFCVYSMPSDLQFCLAMLAEAAWSILFVFIATQGHLDGELG